MNRIGIMEGDCTRKTSLSTPDNIFTDRFKAVLLCGSFLLVMFRVCHVSCLFIAAVWSQAGKELTS